MKYLNIIICISIFISTFLCIDVWISDGFEVLSINYCESPLCYLKFIILLIAVCHASLAVGILYLINKKK